MKEINDKMILNKMPLFEIERAKNEFALLDLDGDGFITLDEVKKWHERHGREFGDYETEKFKQLDKNADGKVSIDEMFEVL